MLKFESGQFLLVTVYYGVGFQKMQF